jgi:hypothetical protein
MIKAAKRDSPLASICWLNENVCRLRAVNATHRNSDVAACLLAPMLPDKSPQGIHMSDFAASCRRAREFSAIGISFEISAFDDDVPRRFLPQIDVSERAPHSE